MAFRQASGFCLKHLQSELELTKIFIQPLLRVVNRTHIRTTTKGYAIAMAPNFTSGRPTVAVWAILHFEGARVRTSSDLTCGSPGLSLSCIYSSLSAIHNYAYPARPFLLKLSRALVPCSKMAHLKAVYSDDVTFCSHLWQHVKGFCKEKKAQPLVAVGHVHYCQAGNCMAGRR